MPTQSCKISGTEIQWYDIYNPSPEELEEVAKKYNLNKFTLIDSQDPDHLPKYEEHDGTHFIIVRTFLDERSKQQSIQSLSSKIAIFYNADFILTIHRFDQSFLGNIRKEYVESGKITDTTGIAVLIVRLSLHTYEQPAIKLGDEIDSYEVRVFVKQHLPDDLVQSIYYLKNRAGLYKKILLLTNEVVHAMRVEEAQKPALQDARDLHTKLLMLYDQIQEDANNLLNIYLSLAARKTNDVVKVLTIFSVFFMPLTFIVGVYGMNFEYMPELRSKWGYPLSLVAMLVVSVIIYIWFKRKKWL